MCEVMLKIKRWPMNSFTVASLTGHTKFLRKQLQMQIIEDQTLCGWI